MAYWFGQILQKKVTINEIQKSNPNWSIYVVWFKVLLRHDHCERFGYIFHASYVFTEECIVWSLRTGWGFNHDTIVVHKCLTGLLYNHHIIIQTIWVEQTEAILINRSTITFISVRSMRDSSYIFSVAELTRSNISQDESQFTLDDIGFFIQFFWITARYIQGSQSTYLSPAEMPVQEISVFLYTICDNRNGIRLKQHWYKDVGNL